MKNRILPFGYLASTLKLASDHARLALSVLGMLLCMDKVFSAQITIEDFVRQPTVSNLALSPDGRFLAMHVLIKGHAGLEIVATDTLKPTAVVDRAVGKFAWANNTRVVMEMQVAVRGNPTPAVTGLVFSVDAVSGHVRSLFPFRHNKPLRYIPDHHKGSAFILDPLIDDPKHILLTVYPYSTAASISAYNTAPEALKVDIRSGHRERTARTSLRNASFLTDRAGTVRFTVAYDKHYDYKLLYRSTRESHWGRFQGWTSEDAKFIPLGFTDDNNSVFGVAANSGGQQGLYQVDLSDGSHKLLLQHPQVDITSVLTMGDGQRVFGVRLDPARPMIVPCCGASRFARILRHLKAAFPRETAEITSVTQDAGRAVVFINSDRNPGQYYLLDTTSAQLRFLYAARHWIDPSRMARRKPIHLEARDGLMLHGYVTLPNDHDSALPAVVLPHGGPYFVRDYWDFDDEAQLLASRGYAVLQINFRGSSGYGGDFYQRGLMQWGGKMQDDVTDATYWLIKANIADRGRICIMGSSYGGYAALMGAVREPKLYRCSIGISGIYDLQMMYDHGDIQQLWQGKGYLGKAIGTDATLLKARSPARHAAEIKAAVLLIHGGQDQRAPLAQAVAMRDALIDAGQHPQWMLERNEGHGFYTPQHQAAMYRKILAFLSTNIGPKTPTDG